MNTVDLSALSLSELVRVYNAASPTPVQKFSTKAIAIRRVQELAERLNMVIIQTETGVSIEPSVDYTADGAEVDPTEDTEEEITPPASSDDEPELPASLRRDSESDIAADEAARAELDKAAAAPHPGALIVMPPKKERGKTASVGGSARSEYRESEIITVLSAPKARPESKRSARFAALRSGMTVGEYLDAAHKANGGARARHRYHSDIRRLVAEGFISVSPKG